jgi:ABC-type lipoprotein export system ATPase subunit
MIELREVAIRYGAVDVLSGISASAPEGSYVTVTGRSGSGKSSLLHVLGGLLRPTAGQVLVTGFDLADASRRALARYRAEQLGFVFQAAHLVPWLDALENVRMGLRYRHGPVSKTARGERDRCMTMLEGVGLAERTSHRPAQLSGGERQRVALARALVSEPRLLLADEPTGNLDAATASEVIEVLETAARPATIVVVTHDSMIAERGQIRWALDGGGLKTWRAA